MNGTGKSTLRRGLETSLRFLAQAVLRRRKPILIGITGSVGKSSAKEAIALVMSERFRVRKTEGNYNNEVGLPLTILGAASGGHSIFGWARVFAAWLRAMFFDRDYPEVLVLELGIDRPGDMAYFTKFLPLHTAVMTNISSSHLAFFGTVSRIAKEKSLIVSRLPSSGAAVLCADDELVMRAAKKTKAKTISFGFGENAAVRATDITLSSAGNEGCHFKLCFDGKIIPVHLPFVAAKQQILSVLAAVAVGTAFKISPLQITAAVRAFRPLAGRMSLVEGLHHSLILDDTYNASPTSLLAAFETLVSLKGQGKTLVVLGDMLELGADSDAAHKAVGNWIWEKEIDGAVLVGRRMLLAYESLRERGFPKKQCFWFENPTDAAQTVREMLSFGDVLLVKGSQGMRMEKVTKAAMAFPERARELLCRQSGEWRAKPFISPKD